MAIRPPRGVTSEPMMPFMGGMAAKPFQPGNPIIKKGIEAIRSRFPKSVISQIRSTVPVQQQLDEALSYAKDNAGYIPKSPNLQKGHAMRNWANNKLIEALSELVKMESPFRGPMGP